MVAVLRDVTERKRQEQALEDARTEAERANAAKGRFLATMSHELRTPLNAIIGFSEMLMKELVLMLDAGRRKEYAGLINDSGHHLLAVINGILDMSKIETDNFEITPEPFPPAQVIAGCCELLALRAREAGVELEKVVSDDLPEMIADKRALNQILLNLLSNAIRFTDRGGKVTISARAEAASIIFVVEDNGVGISERGSAAGRRTVLSGARVLRPPPRRHRPRSLHRQRLAPAARRRAGDTQPARRGHARHRAHAARLRAGEAGQEAFRADRQRNGCPCAGPLAEGRGGPAGKRRVGGRGSRLECRHAGKEKCVTAATKTGAEPQPAPSAPPPRSAFAFGRKLPTVRSTRWRSSAPVLPAS